MSGVQPQIGKMMKNIIARIVSFPVSVRTLAIALLVMTMGAIPAMAETWTPSEVDVPELIDFAALATTMLTILGLAFAAVAGVGLALAVARRIVGWFKGA